MKITQANKKVEKKSVKAPAIQKFEKIFKEIQIQPNIKKESNFVLKEQSTWIVSDNNSTFKSFINYG